MIAKSTFNLLLISTFFSLNSQAQEIDNAPCSIQEWGWAKAIVSDNSYGNKDIATDQEGNLLVAGSFSEKVTIGADVYESKGSEDLYLIKYAPSGLVLWAVTLGGEGYDEVMAVVPDHMGNVYLTGSFVDTLEISGQTVVATGNSPDIFLAKFNIHGELEWLQRHGGDGYDHPGDLAIDTKNNLYLSGSFEETAKIGGKLINSTTNGNGFLLKLNASGRDIWLKQFGDVGPLKLKLGVKNDNHIIVGGTFNKPLRIQKKTLDGGPNSAVFIAEFSANGKLQWLEKATKGESSGTLAALAVDGNALYIGGSFFSSAPNSFFQIGDHIYQGSGGFMAKFAGKGSSRWSKKISSGAFNYVSGIATDHNNNVFATGLLTSNIDFAGKNFTGFGGFVAKYNQDGAPLKFWSTGNFSYEQTNFIAADPDGNLFCTGIFEGTTTFGKDNLSVAGGYNDAYIARLDRATPFLSAEPDTEASGIAFTSTSPSSVKVSWNAGDGAQRLVVIRKLGTVDAGKVTDGTTYHAGEGTYGKGTKMGPNQYVVYKGSGHTTTITGLIPRMRYSVAVFEYNEATTCSGTTNYKTDQFAMASFGELAPKAVAGSNKKWKKANFRVYPNPVEENMNIILSTDYRGKQKFSLIDQRGQVLHQFSAEIKDGITRFSVNLDQYHLKSGIYFLKINNKDMKHNTFRVIKK